METRGWDTRAGDLAGQVVLVTGGARGIGAATARAAARAGADVAITFRTRGDAAQDVVREIQTSGQRGLPLQADVTDRDQMHRAVDKVREAFGQLTGLVNNAATLGKAHFSSMAPAQWENMLLGSLTSAFHATQAALPLLSESAPSSIVNMSSRLGQVGGAGFSHYAAAKAGLLGLTRSLAHELAPVGIRVNAVAPAVVMTQDRRTATEDPEVKEKLRQTPLERFAEPEDIAATVLFLLSGAAAQFTGQTLNPNGGSYMG